MATSIVNLSVPAGTGFGAAADISTLVGEKTVQLSGTFRGSYVLYVSQNGTTYVPLLSFDAGGPEGIKKTFAGSFRYAKILSRASGPSGVSANISGLGEAGANTFVSTTVAAGFSGVSPIEDLGVTFYQDDVCGTLSGQFVGELVVEGSLDGAHFNPVGILKAQAPASGLLGPSTLEFEPFPVAGKIRYMRATLNGAAATDLTLTVGGRQDTTLNPAQLTALATLAADSASVVNADVATVPAGSQIRTNGVTLQFERALADTAAHAGGIIGTVPVDVPVSGSVTINNVKSVPFDSAPVVGQTAYVSVTGPGQASCSVPGTSAIMVPVGTVLADLSVGAAYRGLVAGPSVGMFSPASWEDQMAAETIALLGGEPSRWHTFGDHFDLPTQRGAVGPQWGALGDPSDATAPVHLSCIKIGPRAGAPNAAWYLQGEFIPTTVDMKSLVARFTICAYLYPTDSRVAVMNFNGVPVNLSIIAGRDGSNIELICFDDSQSWLNGTPSPAQTQVLGTVTTGALQQIDLMIGRSGYFAARVLPNAWTPWRQIPGGAYPYSAFAWARARNNQNSQTSYVEIDRVRYSFYE